MFPARILGLLLVVFLVSSAARAQDAGEVSVYVSLDFEFSEAILKDFEARTGIRVGITPDVEENKTVGLVNRIISEQQAGNSRCDVYWNNEVAQTLRLVKRGYTQAYVSPEAAAIPEAFKDPEGHWTGFAARARVIIYNTEQLSAEEAPKRLKDLLDPRWDDRMGMAKPLTGTTLTHAASLFAVWGDRRAKDFLIGLRDRGIRWEAGNAMVMREVAAGSYAWGYTDTDDANVSRLKGQPTDIVVPDQEDGGLGTLLIPNSVAILRGARNLDNARRLVDFLLSEEVEARLAAGRSAQIPLRPGVAVPEGGLRLEDLRAMEVDWQRVADMIDVHQDWLHRTFQDGGDEPGRKASWILWAALGALLALVLVLVLRKR